MPVITPTGGVGGGALPAWWTIDDTALTASFAGALTIQGAFPAVDPLRGLDLLDIVGIAGQLGDYLNISDSLGAPVFRVLPSGNALFAHTLEVDDLVTLTKSGIGTAQFGTNDGFRDIVAYLTSALGNPLWYVTASGHEVVFANTPPADADIQPGECFSWFDDTNGAAKFWRKGKTANGTVVITSAAMT